MNKPKLIIFASGTKTNGGSGFENLVTASRSQTGGLEANIIAVVSNHEKGGVWEKANCLGVPFIHFAGPWTAEKYKETASRADFVALSGWLKLISGLDPRTTFNIHPGLLPQFGGPGMYGHHVHEAVMAAYHRGEIKNTGISMHFVTEEYDKGPIFFQSIVPILPTDNAESLAKRVNKREHECQPFVTDAVIHGRIHWDGVNPDSLVTPKDWKS